MKLKKLWMLGISALALLSFSTVHAEQQPEIEVYINGELELLEQAPILVEQEPYVPMKEIYTAFGAQVNWNKETNHVEAVHPEGSVSVDLDSMTISVDDAAFETSAPSEKPDLWPVEAQMIDGRVMIPLQVVNESLNVSVKHSEELGYILFDTEIEYVPEPETMQGKGIFVDGYLYADYLSFLIQEITEEKLHMSFDTYLTLVDHANHFFSSEREERSLEDDAEELDAEQWAGLSDLSKIVKTGSMQVSEIEEKHIQEATNLMVISGEFLQEEPLNGLIFYFGDATLQEGDKIDFVGVRVGQFQTEAEEPGSEDSIVVAIAGNLWVSEIEQQDSAMDESTPLNETE